MKRGQLTDSNNSKTSFRRKKPLLVNPAHSQFESKKDQVGHVGQTQLALPRQLRRMKSSKGSIRTGSRRIAVRLSESFLTEDDTIVKLLPTCGNQAVRHRFTILDKLVSHHTASRYRKDIAGNFLFNLILGFLSMLSLLVCLGITMGFLPTSSYDNTSVVDKVLMHFVLFIMIPTIHWTLIMNIDLFNRLIRNFEYCYTAGCVLLWTISASSILCWGTRAYVPLVTGITSLFLLSIDALSIQLRRSIMFLGMIVLFLINTLAFFISLEIGSLERYAPLCHTKIDLGLFSWTIKDLCVSSGFTVVIYFLKSLWNVLKYPDCCVILKAKLKRKKKHRKDKNPQEKKQKNNRNMLYLRPSMFKRDVVMTNRGFKPTTNRDHGPMITRDSTTSSQFGSDLSQRSSLNATFAPNFNQISAKTMRRRQSIDRFRFGRGSSQSFRKSLSIRQSYGSWMSDEEPMTKTSLNIAPNNEMDQLIECANRNQLFQGIMLPTVLEMEERYMSKDSLSTQNYSKTQSTGNLFRNSMQSLQASDLTVRSKSTHQSSEKSINSLEYKEMGSRSKIIGNFAMDQVIQEKDEVDAQHTSQINSGKTEIIPESTQDTPTLVFPATLSKQTTNGSIHNRSTRSLVYVDSQALQTLDNSYTHRRRKHSVQSRFSPLSVNPKLKSSSKIKFSSIQVMDLPMESSTCLESPQVVVKEEKVHQWDEKDNRLDNELKDTPDEILACKSNKECSNSAEQQNQPFNDPLTRSTSQLSNEIVEQVALANVSMQRSNNVELCTKGSFSRATSVEINCPSPTIDELPTPKSKELNLIKGQSQGSSIVSNENDNPILSKRQDSLENKYPAHRLNMLSKILNRLNSSLPRDFSKSFISSNPKMHDKTANLNKKDHGRDSVPPIQSSSRISKLARWSNYVGSSQNTRIWPMHSDHFDDDCSSRQSVTLSRYSSNSSYKSRQSLESFMSGTSQASNVTRAVKSPIHLVPQFALNIFVLIPQTELFLVIPRRTVIRTIFGEHASKFYTKRLMPIMSKVVVPLCSTIGAVLISTAIVGKLNNEWCIVSLITEFIIFVHLMLMSNSFVMLQLFRSFEFVYLLSVLILWTISTCMLFCWDYRSASILSVSISQFIFMTLDSRSTANVRQTLPWASIVTVGHFFVLVSLNLGLHSDLCQDSFSFVKTYPRSLFTIYGHGIERDEARALEDSQPFTLRIENLVISTQAISLLFLVKLLAAGWKYKGESCIILKSRLRFTRSNTSSAQHNS